MTPERIARLWAAVCGGKAAVARSVECLMASGCGPVTVHVARAFDVGWRVQSAVAYGLTEAEAFGALWELVVLHARVRRDEINAALAAEGMRV